MHKEIVEWVKAGLSSLFKNMISIHMPISVLFNYIIKNLHWELCDIEKASGFFIACGGLPRWKSYGAFSNDKCVLPQWKYQL